MTTLRKLGESNNLITNLSLVEVVEFRGPH